LVTRAGNLPGRPVTEIAAAGFRLTSIVTLALGALLTLAPVAMAADGVGLYGRTDDKVITFFAFGVMAFFAILVIVLSLIQIRLDRNKERRTQDLERLGS
jgi:hypothetical protein